MNLLYLVIYVRSWVVCLLLKIVIVTATIDALRANKRLLYEVTNLRSGRIRKINQLDCLVSFLLKIIIITKRVISTIDALRAKNVFLCWYLHVP